MLARRLTVLLAALLLLAPGAWSFAATCAETECPCCPEQDRQAPEIERSCCCATAPAPEPAEPTPGPERAAPERAPEAPAPIATAQAAPDPPAPPAAPAHPRQAAPRARSGPGFLGVLNGVFLC